MTDPLHHTLLGTPAAIPSSPEQAVLDTVPNPQAGTLFLARFTCPEFTSLCPVTGQPDFGHLMIDYAPGAFLRESKPHKLCLFSFRNHGVFHEDCPGGMGKRIVDAIKPQWPR